MRLKNVPGAREAIDKSDCTVTEPELWKGRWQDLFPAGRPLHMEIGMGKGQFLLEMASRHPEVNYLGLEKYSSVLVRAVQKQEQKRQPNLFLVRADAQYLTEYFAPGEVNRIYLNFSDPWPKDRHAHRRLTSRQFLERYRNLLAPGGWIEFKTDNTDLFDFSLEELEQAGWELMYCTRNLHSDPLGEGNVMTEYEERFSGRGNPICKLAARPPAAVQNM